LIKPVFAPYCKSPAIREEPKFEMLRSTFSARRLVDILSTTSRGGVGGRTTRQLHVSPVYALGKEDLVKIVAENTNYAKANTKEVVDSLFATIVNSVAKGTDGQPGLDFNAKGLGWAQYADPDAVYLL
jgi:Bacterial DNA-binding protein